MVADALRLRHGNLHLARYGRNGQRQHGIDGHDPVSPIAERIVWQSTLQGRRLLQKLRADIASMDRGLGYQPRLFVAAFGVNRDASLQLELSRLSVDRQLGGKCALEPLFWEDIHDIIAADSDAAQKYGYSGLLKSRGGRRPSRGAAVTLSWAAAEEYVGHASYPAATIPDGVLELPLSVASPVAVGRLIDEEIAVCILLLKRKKFSAYWELIANHKSRCEEFASTVLTDSKQFAEWHLRQHARNARWVALSLGNTGSVPASKVHVRLTLPPWLHLRTSFDFHGPSKWPYRPTFFSVGKDGSKIYPNRMNREDLEAFFEIAIATPPVLPLPKGASLDVHPSGEMEVHCSSLTHLHVVKFGLLGAIAGLGVEPGDYEISYETFHVRDTEFRPGMLRVRLIAVDRQLAYDQSLQEAIRLSRQIRPPPAAV
jgi:hypothetical protein